MPRANSYSDSTIRSFLTSAGIPTGGTVFYLDTVNGSDSNDGKAPNKAFKTLIEAEGYLTANKNDVLVQIAGATAASTSTTGLDWDKNYTHYIGFCADVAAGKRARVTASSTSVVASMFTVSASGCIFRNLQFFYGVASAAAKYAVKVTGQRNEFTNCQISGIGDATQDVSGACSLYLNGADECTFKDCYIGLNTIARGTAVNSEILVDSTALRNHFKNCFLTAMIEADTHTFVTLSGTSAIGSEMVFDNCVFNSQSVNHGITMASAFTIPANHTTAYIILRNCGTTEITAWDAATRGHTFIIDGTTSADSSSGFAAKI